MPRDISLQFAIKSIIATELSVSEKQTSTQNPERSKNRHQIKTKKKQQ